jgi:hypothetical protein
MITRNIETEQYNRVVVNHRYPFDGACLCTVQMVNESGEVEWSEGNLVFPAEMLNLTEEEINELSPENHADSSTG